MHKSSGHTSETLGAAGQGSAAKLHNSLERNLLERGSISIENSAGITVERARVVSVQRGGAGQQSTVWLEAFRRSTCGDCAARDACGQGVLGRWFARKQRHYCVRCNATQASLLTVGQWVEVGIPDGVMLRASMLAYLLPVAGLLFGAVLGEWLRLADLWVALCGLAGLYTGFTAGRWWSEKLITGGAAEPTLLDPQSHHAV